MTHRKECVRFLCSSDASTASYHSHTPLMTRFRPWRRSSYHWCIRCSSPQCPRTSPAFYTSFLMRYLLINLRIRVKRYIYYICRWQKCRICWHLIIFRYHLPFLLKRSDRIWGNCIGCRHWRHHIPRRFLHVSRRMCHFCVFYKIIYIYFLHFFDFYWCVFRRVRFWEGKYQTKALEPAMEWVTSVVEPW